ncbi:MAG: DUF86 domain-containing protein [Candidatus Brocadia sp.]|nr:DUF86 domain-containing protein [Candidatus Brocadia sp.]
MRKLSTIKIHLLKEYFSGRPEVSMAFLFGSYAKGQAFFDSDVDIAVYFQPRERRLEWEETGEWPEEMKIWADTEKILGKNVDILVLNKAPCLVAFDAVHTGIPLVIKDHSLYLRFLLTINSAAIDFKEFVKDYWQIEQRSTSLSDFDKTRLIEIIKFLTNEIDDWNIYRELTWDEYQNDRVKRRSLEHWIENIVNASIDIAKILLASEKKSLPGTYREVLRSFMSLKNFDKYTAERLSEFARLRNIITHEYLNIRWEQITNFVKTAKPLFEYTVEFVKKNFLW